MLREEEAQPESGDSQQLGIALRFEMLDGSPIGQLSFAGRF